jgi:hypothetical protein
MYLRTPESKKEQATPPQRGKRLHPARWLYCTPTNAWADGKDAGQMCQEVGQLSVGQAWTGAVASRELSWPAIRRIVWGAARAQPDPHHRRRHYRIARQRGLIEDAKTVALDDGTALPYDRLLIATGAGARRPSTVDLGFPQTR